MACGAHARAPWARESVRVSVRLRPVAMVVGVLVVLVAVAHQADEDRGQEHEHERLQEGHKELKEGDLVKKSAVPNAAPAKK